MYWFKFHSVGFSFVLLRQSTGTPAFLGKTGAVYHGDKGWAGIPLQTQIDVTNYKRQEREGLIIIPRQAHSVPPDPVEWVHLAEKVAGKAKKML